MNRPAQPPSPRSFSIIGLFYKAVFLYFLLMPPAIAAVFLFFPHVPDPKQMMEQAGPLGLLLLARIVLVQGSFLAIPSAIMLAFARSRFIVWVLLALYITLVGAWVLKLLG